MKSLSSVNIDYNQKLKGDCIRFETCTGTLIRITFQFIFNSIYVLQKGLVCVWSVDARGSLTPTRQYRRKGEITSAVFCVMPAATVVVPQTASQLSVQSVLSGQRKAENKQASSPAFFFGTEHGLYGQLRCGLWHNNSSSRHHTKDS